MLIKNIGIIGNGFVGEALAFAFSPSIKTKVYDLDASRSINSIDDTLNYNIEKIIIKKYSKKKNIEKIFFKNKYLLN